MKGKLVTAITTKNEDWIIQKTLDAVCKFSDEVVIYDDGSTDSTEEICRSYEKVSWSVRIKDNPGNREEAKQRQGLINLLKKYEPNYVLLLDADEIPTPSIIPFLNNIERNSVESWKVRMINLWFNEKIFRVDQFTTKYGTSVNWNPFSKKPWFKCPLMKFDLSREYYYDLSVDAGGCSSNHPAPENLKGEVELINDFYLIHYGWLSDKTKTGSKSIEMAEFRTNSDPSVPVRTRLDWHSVHTVDTKSTFMPCQPEWFWSS